MKPAVLVLTLRRFFLLIVFAGSIFSCSKDDDPAPNNNNNNNPSCTTPAAPTVGSNTPVTSGQSIQLTASTVANAESYSWTGPNSFTSNEQNPVIPSATSANAGTYSVTVTVTGGCTSAEAITNVAVTAPSAPCNPTNNQYTLSGLPSVSFTPMAIQFGVGVTGNYEITCNGGLGDIRLEFAIPSKPTAGVYRITNLGPLASADEVKVSNTTSSSYWGSASGFLYVTTSGGKNQYVYCDVDFSSSTWGITTQGSGKITEP